MYYLAEYKLGYNKVYNVYTNIEHVDGWLNRSVSIPTTGIPHTGEIKNYRCLSGIKRDLNISSFEEFTNNWRNVTSRLFKVWVFGEECYPKYKSVERK